MPDTFEQKVLNNAQILFKGVGRVLLAVSGGADSVMMAYAMNQLRQRRLLACDFVIGHVNHGLRGGDSDGDEAFVSELGRQLGIEVVMKSVPVRDYAAKEKLSIETAGRILRLKTLVTIAQEKNCGVIATAHHKDDLAETMLHRLMRGTGFRGLCGIHPVSVVYGAKFIRPMLDVRRSEIIQYARQNNLTWHHDASNDNTNFTRNRIRHQLLPVLQETNGSIVDGLFKLSEKSRRFLSQTKEQAEAVLANGQFDELKGEYILEQALLEGCPPWVFYEVVRGMLTGLDVGLRDYKQEHFELIYQLPGQKKATSDLPGGVEAVVEKGVLQFRRRVGGFHPPDDSEKSVFMEFGKTVQFGTWEISSKLLKREEVDIEQFLKTKNESVEWFDADKISAPVQIRSRQEGDRFWPIGATGSKKVGRFLMDAGLDPEKKRQAFIIEDAEKILWLAPIRMSEKVKITGGTQRILQLSIKLSGKSYTRS